MRSTIGRPRALTEPQVKTILAWHIRYLLWKALRATLKSQRELARELGVSQATVSHVIRIRGEYKQIPPEERARAQQKR
jgi:predicted transcriptional regulator